MYKIFSMHYITSFVQKRDVEDDWFYIHHIAIIYCTFSNENLLKMGRRHEKKHIHPTMHISWANQAWKAHFQVCFFLLPGKLEFIPPCTSIPLALHLGHGLRPMNRGKKAFAYVLAQRKCFFVSIRMAHCYRIMFVLHKKFAKFLHLQLKCCKKDMKKGIK